MKLAMCHYSLHRVCKEKNWTPRDVAKYVRELGIGAVDFHQGFLPSQETAVQDIMEAVTAEGLEISGLSLRTNFNQVEPEAFRNQVETAKAWLKISRDVKAPASRVFGGGMKEFRDEEKVGEANVRVIAALKELEPVAREYGVILALENHGGLPCSGKQQSELIETINSPFVKATVDIGNYMRFPQKAEEGVADAVKHCAYVHIKDFTDNGDGTLTRATIGEGSIDIPKCMQIIRDCGFDGYAAIEYEGEEDELTGVPKSVEYMKKLFEEMKINSAETVAV